MERDGDSTIPPGEARPDVTARSATFIGSFALLGRIVERIAAFGLIVLIASVFGSTFQADLYFIASIVPLLIGTTAGDAVGTSLLPALVRAEADPDTEDRVLATCFWVVLGGLLAITAAYVAAATVVVHVAAPAGDSRLAPWLAFAPLAVLIGLSGYLAAVLLRYQRYVWPPFRMAVSSACALAFAGLVLLFSHDIAFIGAAVSAGWAVSVTLMLAEVVHVAGWRAFGRPSRAAAQEIAGLGRKTASAAASGLLGGQVFVLIERFIAASAGVGAVATLSYARGIAFIPSIFAQAIAIGVYPGMVRAHERREPDVVRDALLRGLRLTLFVGVASATYIASYGTPIANAVLQRGKLGVTAADAVGAVLAAFALAVVGNVLLILATRTFFATDYFRAAILAQSAVLVVYLVVAFPLRETWGLPGLALAFGVAELTGGVTAFALATRRLALPRMGILRDAVFPALFRAALVLVPLAAYRIAIDHVNIPVSLRGATAAGGSGVLLLAMSAVVLWFAGWPETERLKAVGLRIVRRDP